MKGLVIYGSTTGNTRKAANKLPELLNFPVEIIDVKTVINPNIIFDYDLVLFFASTWGDGELQIDMEDFFVRYQLDLKEKNYALCELGNYYGYDDFEFGALEIMQKYLNQWNGKELIEPFCLDSLPRRDWGNFSRWCNAINKLAVVQS